MSRTLGLIGLVGGVAGLINLILVLIGGGDWSNPRRPGPQSGDHGDLLRRDAAHAGLDGVERHHPAASQGLTTCTGYQSTHMELPMPMSDQPLNPNSHRPPARRRRDALGRGIPVTFKTTGRQSGGQFAAIEVTEPPGSASPIQYNKVFAMANYVLEGTATLANRGRDGGDRPRWLRLSAAGHGVSIP